MSMQLDILSDRLPISIAEWQGEIDAEGYPLKLMPDTKIHLFSAAAMGGEADEPRHGG